jgi:signal transduction histidine kinase
MFRRYSRLSARPTGGEPSTGLGLSIVKKLVLAMHGELSCESTPGNGATFTVRLPRAAILH